MTDASPTNDPASEDPSTQDMVVAAAPNAADEGPGLRSLVAFSLLTGLCGLIPVPFLDDWAAKLIRRRAVRHLCRSQDVHVTDEEVEYLAHGDQSFQMDGCLKGCFLGALMRTVLYGVRKIFSKVFRTILFFLTLRSVLNTFSRSFHEGYVLRHALRLGVLPQGSPSSYPEPLQDLLRSSVVSLRYAIEIAFESQDHGPLTKILRTTLVGSRGVLRHTARSITRLLRPLRRRNVSEEDIARQMRQESEEELGGLIDSLTQEISRENAYLKRMEETLEEALGLSATTDPSES